MCKSNGVQFALKLYLCEFIFLIMTYVNENRINERQHKFCVLTDMYSHKNWFIICRNKIKFKIILNILIINKNIMLVTIWFINNYNTRRVISKAYSFFQGVTWSIFEVDCSSIGLWWSSVTFFWSSEFGEVQKKFTEF